MTASITSSNPTRTSTSRSTAAGGFSAQSFAASLAARDEPGWLSDLRRAAWQRFEELPLPSLRDEEWMRTDIRLFRLGQFDIPSQTATAQSPPPPLLTAGLDLAGRAGSLDSTPIAGELQSKWSDQGVLFGSLDQMVRDHADLLRPHFERRAVDPYQDKFSALSASCWSGGMLLYVPKGVTVDQPFHSLSALTDGGVDLGRTLVILEDDAEATLLTETASQQETDSGLHCGTIELLMGNDARLRYVNLQNWGTNVWHFAHQNAIVQRDSQLQWTIGALGSRLAKVNQHVTLTGAGANVQVNGVMFTQGRQHLSYHTLQHHTAPACHSDLLYKAALQDKTRTVWRGMIKVAPEAQRTDAYQRNDNLMLSASARADSIPGLEIKADDVRCTHGSTSGRVDEEQILYCQSRGLTRREAVRIVVTGFFQQVFDRITLENVREALGLAITRRIREYD